MKMMTGVTILVADAGFLVTVTIAATTAGMQEIWSK